MQRRWYVLGVAVTAALTGSSASDSVPATELAAHPPCDARERILLRLTEHYGEVPTARGLTSKGALLEVLSDPKDGSWTVVITDSEKQSCILRVGTDWQMVKDERES